MLRNLHAIIFELYPSYYRSEVSPGLVREQLERLHELWDINKRRFGYTSSVDHIHDDDDDEMCDGCGGDADDSYSIITEDVSSIHSGSDTYHRSPYSVEEWEYTLVDWS